jgi:hypothetical protein
MCLEKFSVGGRLESTKKVPYGFICLCCDGESICPDCLALTSGKIWDEIMDQKLCRKSKNSDNDHFCHYINSNPNNFRSQPLEVCSLCRDFKMMKNV